MTTILGINAYHGDSAVALVRDGELIAACEEERYNRIKHWAGFPGESVRRCLEIAGIGIGDVDHVALSFDPGANLLRRLWHLGTHPGIWGRVRGRLSRQGRGLGVSGRLAEVCGVERVHARVHRVEHHRAHLASAFLVSGWEEAAVLSVDGMGDFTSTVLAGGVGSRIREYGRVYHPHSLGLLYNAVTLFLGFPAYGDEYKVMGLAPYGEPKYVDHILGTLMDLKPDGSFRLDMDYFNYCAGLTMTGPRFHDLFGAPPVKQGGRLGRREMDIARSIQAVTEEVVLRLCRTAHELTGSANLVMAGGVALNCVANGRVQRESPFARIWIQPAAGDAGGAIGAAYAAAMSKGETPPAKNGTADGMRGSYLGPEYDEAAIRGALSQSGAVFEELDDDTLFDVVAGALADEQVVGWFQGGMEFGPRALGNRSILGDPRSPKMQRILNLKIKYRESFRPFAPAVLADRASEYFDINVESPYMLLVAQVREERHRAPTKAESELEGIAKLNVVRSDIPAITHVDYSARIQTVDGRHNPRFHRLLTAFERRTGCAVLVNTSFNVRDEPIVCSPSDAYRCFLGTEMDMLVVGNAVLRKSAQC